MRPLLLAPLVAPIVGREVGLTGDQIGGTQTYLADLATRLAGRGHAVTLVGAPGSRIAGVEVVELPIGHLGLRPAHFDGEHGRAALAYRGVSHITMPVDLQEQAADKPSKRGVPGHTSDVFARSARLPDEAELRRAADRSPAASRTARRSP